MKELAEYDFEIRYCPGLENQAADFLSRLQNGQETDADYQMDYKQLSKGLVVIQKTEGGGNSLFESLHSFTFHFFNFLNDKHLKSK